MQDTYDPQKRYEGWIRTQELLRVRALFMAVRIFTTSTMGHLECIVIIKKAEPAKEAGR